MGPTASGKSEWALALAQRERVEIISVDSAQVYRGLDIGTAKPSADSRRDVPHHLIDIRELEQQYTAGDFVRDAQQLIRDIQSRGAWPVLVGGTALYFKALVHGLAPLPQADAALRARLDSDAERLGWPALHQRLERLDPQSAARIRPTDSQRIQRALELIELTGGSLAEAHAHTPPSVEDAFSRWALAPTDRPTLHRRIERRLAAMLENGWVDELHVICARVPDVDRCAALRAVGYRQLLPWVQGRTRRAPAVAAALAATRQLAKRQMTWVRGDPGWRQVDPFAPGSRDEWLNRVTVQHGPAEPPRDRVAAQ
jgi:tRNA dimethylallyltransferase